MPKKRINITPREQWPEFITPKELVKLMEGLIGQPTAYEIFKDPTFPSVVIGGRFVAKSEHFFTWWDSQLEQAEKGTWEGESPVFSKILDEME